MRNGVVVCAAVAVTAFASGCSNGSAPTGQSAVPGPPAVQGQPSSAAVRFLAEFVTSDGRVIRHDQGGDIVSEGQAYGMLIAEMANRPAMVRKIWSWTSAHLSRSDGLLKYHASGSGRIESDQSATDADVLAAYALLRYRGISAGSLHSAGRHIATSVLTAESTSRHGSPVLLAGPWALTTSPPTVNPSYWMPSVFEALARYTGGDRWHTAADTSIALLQQMTHDGRDLPTDWAQLSDSGLVPIADPGGGAPVQYGLDAARLPLWFATSCDPTARRLAARWWTNHLAIANRTADLALTPSGTPIDQQTNPLPLLAGAAAAAAAGDRTASRELQARAAQQARQVPTYYGDAWLAIGGALLDGSLNPCQEAAGG